MRIRTLGAIALAAGVMLAGPVAAETPQRGGVLIQAYVTEVTSMDAHQARAGDSRVMLGPYAAYLVYVDSEGNFLPGLATGWEWETETQLRLDLREGVTFHDGTPFNAEAVAFNVDRIAGRTEPAIVSPGAADMRAVTGIEVVDDLTIRLSFDQVRAGFIQQLGAYWAGMLSPTAIEEMGDSFALAPVSAGPFRVTEYRPGAFVTYERFADFYGVDEHGEQLPYLDGMRLMILPDNASRAAALQAGDIHLDQRVEAAQVMQLEADPNINIVEIPGFNARWIAFNTGLAPLDNVHVRRAIIHAINPEEINMALHQGRAAPANQFFSPTSWAHDPDAPWLEYSPEKAREEMALAGFPDGFSFSAAHYGGPWRAEAELIQSQLRRVGIDMQVDAMDLASFSQLYRRDAVYHAGFTGHPMTARDPAHLFHSFHHSTGAFADPSRTTVYDEVIDRALLTLDDAERGAVLSEAFRMVYERAGEAYYIWVPAHRAFRQNVHGYVLYSDGTSDCVTCWLAR